MKDTLKTIATVIAAIIVGGCSVFVAWLILTPFVGSMAPSLISIGIVGACCFYWGWKGGEAQGESNARWAEFGRDIRATFNPDSTD